VDRYHLALLRRTARIHHTGPWYDLGLDYHLRYLYGVVRLAPVRRIFQHNSRAGRQENVTNPDETDAVFIMGRNNSAFVLEGSRKDVKDWTARSLLYKDRPGIPSSVWQGFTRLGSFLVLLFIFSAILNGSTVDQVAFILLNGMAQMNVLVSQQLNSQRCLSKLRKLEDTQEKTRTHIYARLLRRFRNAEQKKKWVGASGLLPKTDIWDKWRVQVVLDNQKDPKELYKEISDSIDNLSKNEFNSRK
jgi:hypothetical protein